MKSAFFSKLIIIGFASTVAILSVGTAFGQVPSSAELQSQLQSLLQQVEQIRSGATGAPGFTKNLGLGSTDATSGGEVSRWQNFLADQDKGQYARELKNGLSFVPRGYFGHATGRATQEWQRAMGIAPTCACVGPRTRAAVANLGRSQEQLRVVTPNGGEIVDTGQTHTVRWTGPAVIPQGYRLVIALTGGPTSGTIGVLTSDTYDNKRYDWEVNGVAQGDVMIPVQPGSYKLKLVLYDDGYFCLGLCPPPTPQSRIAQIVAQDESDATFQVTATPPLTITSILPTSGLIGTQVTITGTGFSATNNAVLFDPIVPGCGWSTLANATNGGTAITFSVPATSHPCTPGAPNLPGGITYPITAGTYQIRVHLGAGRTSNNINFTVTPAGSSY